MSLTRIQSFEGQILSTIEAAGPENVADVARDMIDAGSNILVRLEGSRQAAAFTFALGDRIVGQILGRPAEAPIYLPALPSEMARIQAAVPTHKPTRFWQGYVIGAVAGTLWGFCAGRWL